MTAREPLTDPLLPGLPVEIGDAITCLAEAELAADRPDSARALLDGLVVAHEDAPTAWALLSRTHRKLGQPLAARFCAEVALRLAPANPEVRLAHAESQLALPAERADGRRALGPLAADGEVGPRARALLSALGE
jgi:predicted Zn-dependent protease